MNIKTRLSEELYNKYLNYVCYERTYQYILNLHLNNMHADLFYADRILGYCFNNEKPEPLLRPNNFLERYIGTFSQNKNVSKEVIWDELLSQLSNNMVQVAMEMYNAQNEPYYTSVLLEGVKDEIVYYTKISETCNEICYPIRKEEILLRLQFDDHEMTSLEILDIAKAKNVKEKSIEDVLFSLKEEKEYDGINDYIIKQKECFIDSNLEKLNEKNMQLRFGKHVLNKLYPIWFFLSQYQKLRHDDNLLAENEALKINIDSLGKISNIIMSTRNKKYLNDYFKSLDSISIICQRIKCLYKKGVIR